MSIFIPVAPKLTKTVLPHHPWKNRIKAKYSNKYQHGHNSVLNPIFTAKTPYNENCDNQQIQFTVIGNRVTKEFIYCMYLVKGLHKCRRRQFKAPVIKGVTGVEWPIVWNDLKLKHGGIAFCLQSQVAVLKDGEFLGGDKELKEFVDSRYIYTIYRDYYKEGIQQFANYIRSSGRPCVYMNISINREPIGSLIFILYADIAPLTCQNFLNMCQSNRGGYSGTPVHRIVQDCWIQCGGFTLKNKTQLECENYIVPHDRRGVLGMTNAGRNKDCSTQFFVLLQPASWMNNKYVAFGQLIDGENTLSKIENVPTWYESPTSEILIDKAGVLNLECQRTTINKRTNEYIQGHIEDLVVIGNLFYEALLERVFKEIEIRLLSQLEEILLSEQSKEESDDSIFSTKRLYSKKNEKELKTGVINEDEENNEYDVEMYDYEDIFNETPSTPHSRKEKIITKPFYLPLKDVPYPGEVDSIYDLQRFLKGDYCLKSDLPKRPERPHKLFETKISKNFLDTLFDYLTIDISDISDTSLTESEEKLLQSYIRENTDSVSFAGRIVQKIANLPQKLAIFGNVSEYKSQVLSEDEMRIISVSKKEITELRRRSVSITLPSSKLPRGLIHRRPTGFVHAEDIASLLGEIEPGMEDEENISQSSDSIGTSSSELSLKTDRRLQLDHMNSDSSDSFVSKISHKTRDEPIRKVTIAQNKNTHSKQGDHEQGSPKISVLTRLYDNVRMKKEDMVLPTLKSYKPLAVTPSNNYWLTQSSFNIADDEPRNKYYRQNNQSADYSLDYVLHLQHGKRTFRKISSDYVRTIDHIEHQTQNSLRSVEYAKKRPTMTVQEYQLRNRKYRETLMTTHDKATETSS